MYKWNQTGILNLETKTLISNAIEINDDYNELFSLVNTFLKYEFPEYNFMEISIFNNSGNELSVTCFDDGRNQIHYFNLRFSDDIYILSHKTI